MHRMYVSSLSHEIESYTCKVHLRIKGIKYTSGTLPLKLDGDYFFFFFFFFFFSLSIEEGPQFSFFLFKPWYQIITSACLTTTELKVVVHYCVLILWEVEAPFSRLWRFTGLGTQESESNKVKCAFKSKGQGSLSLLGRLVRCTGVHRLWHMSF